MKRDFEKFLTRHRAYRRYFRALYTCYPPEIDDVELYYNRLLNLTPARLIGGAFSWEKTIEHDEKGQEYWLQLHNLWIKQLEKIEKKGN